MTLDADGRHSCDKEQEKIDQLRRIALPDQWEHFSDWMVEWVRFAQSVGLDTSADTMAKKVTEEMQEWLDEPSVKETIDVIACLTLWAVKVGYDPDRLLALANERLTVWRGRTWEEQPDGTYHHV